VLLAALIVLGALALTFVAVRFERLMTKWFGYGKKK
jgi:hypothetical protein